MGIHGENVETELQISHGGGGGSRAINLASV